MFLKLMLLVAALTTVSAESIQPNGGSIIYIPSGSGSGRSLSTNEQIGFACAFGGVALLIIGICIWAYCKNRRNEIRVQPAATQAHPAQSTHPWNRDAPVVITSDAGVVAAADLQAVVIDITN